MLGNSVLLFIQCRAKQSLFNYLYSDLDNSQVLPGSCDSIVNGSKNTSIRIRRANTA